MHYAEIKCGFEWGCAKILRLFSDEEKGWIALGIETPKFESHNGLHVYITKTGKVRVFDTRGEWVQPKPPRNNMTEPSNNRPSLLELEMERLTEFRKERKDFWAWRKEERIHRRIMTCMVVFECVALVIIAYFALLFHT